eukprot:gb/GFBE01042735.1/.p1 GENE.gb/GFBE01042735.1/~~gb/GFBE01042735.1/.p1  ORF type:complete len:320 (+),score=47.24 gb/GFBE01042735.1/:1-960(+)
MARMRKPAKNADEHSVLSTAPSSMTLVAGAAGRSEISPCVDFIAAGLVSSLSKILVYPMETKVLLIALGEAAAKNPMRLWHGVAVKGFENFIYNGLLWFLKERIRPPAPDPAKPESRPPASFWKAFCASCLAILLVHPLSNIVVGMQASLKNPSQLPLSAYQVARAIFREHGPGGFFAGWGFSIVLRVGSAATIVVYDLVRLRGAGLLGQDAANFVAGLLGRLSEVYACHPFKTLRSRQQQGLSLLNAWNPVEVLRLWNGVGTMAIADAVKIGIRFLLIERLRVFLQWALDRLSSRNCSNAAKAPVDEVSTGGERAMGG